MIEFAAAEADVVGIAMVEEQPLKVVLKVEEAILAEDEMMSIVVLETHFDAFLAAAAAESVMNVVMEFLYHSPVLIAAAVHAL